MRIATWNVNSVRQREQLILDWLARRTPDLVALQEIKCEEAAFPRQAFADLGYQAIVCGQKSYNGVAILARHPVKVVHTTLPGDTAPTPQARYLEVELEGITFGNLYLPNGNSGGPEGYAYKLRWMEWLRERARTLIQADAPLVLLGDYNVCPTDEDLAQGALPATDALVRAESRAAFNALIWLGLTDAVRALHPHGACYTFWDYQAGAWPRDVGLRIDHLLLSPAIAERLTAATIERDERAKPQPSDHVPVMIDLN